MSELKKIPNGAKQHVTAGPYSPVLEVECKKLVIISGSAAIAMDGSIVGTTIEEQAKKTLENCLFQLGSAGCTFDDVFKVNVFMKDLGDWARFNEVYKTFFPDPKPVRTAVQVGLLPDLLCEVELWAMKE